MARSVKWILIALALLAGLWAAAPAPAQDQSAEKPVPTEQASPAPPQIPEGQRSPRALVQGFLDAYQAWLRSGHAEDADHMLRCMPPEVREALDRAGVKPAARLAAVLEQLIALQWWPPILPDSGAGTGEFRLKLTVPERAEAVDFLLVKDADGAWRFSLEAVDVAEEMHAELFSMRPEYRLRNLYLQFGLERLVSGRLLGVRYYQWITLFALILIGVIIDFIVRSIVILITRRYLKRQEDGASRTDARQLIRRSARPFGLVAGGTFVYLTLPILQLPVQGEGILLVAAKAFSLFAGLWASFRVVDLIGEWGVRRSATTATRIDDLLVPLLRRAAKLFLLALGLIVIAESLNLPVTSLLAGFGIAGAAIAFASKDTIENLFGSVAVILDRPFHPGDWVVIGDVEGVVESFGFRSTRIRTFYNSQITMPNATLVRAKVDNYGRRRFRRFKTNLGVTYDTPPERIEAFCEGIRELIRQHPMTRKDFFEVHMNAFGAHSLDILVYMFFKVPDWSAELRERHRFCLDIIRLAQQLDIDFAFPTQTIHMAQPNGDSPAREPTGDRPGRMPESNAQEWGRKAAGDILVGAEFRKDDRKR